MICYAVRQFSQYCFEDLVFPSYLVLVEFEGGLCLFSCLVVCLLERVSDFYSALLLFLSDGVTLHFVHKDI